MNEKKEILNELTQALNNLPFKVLSDNDPMPFGKHQGTKMANVPADYLLWLHDNNKCNASVKNYIIRNLNALRKEAPQSKGAPDRIDYHVRRKK